MIRQLTIVAVLLSLGISGLHSGLAQDLRPVLHGSPTSVENFVQDVFYMTQSSGSLTLAGRCMSSTNVDDQVVSDSILHPPEGPFHNVGEALSALSRVDPNISWTRDPQRLLRVRDDRVREDVLRIHLKRVHFSGIVDPNEAIWSVLSAPEVRAYFKKNNIEDALIFNHLWAVGTNGSPRLSGDLHDVSVAEALDRIMQFFHGLWIYGECSKDSIRRVMVKGISTGLPGTNESAARRISPR